MSLPALIAIEQSADHRMPGFEALMRSVVWSSLIYTIALVAAWAIADPRNFSFISSDFSSAAAIIVASLLFLFTWAAAWLVMIMIAMIVGLPLTTILARHQLERIWTYPFCGAITGPAVIVLLVGLEDTAAYEWLSFAGPAMIAGGWCGWLWWRYAREPIAFEGEANA